MTIRINPLNARPDEMPQAGDLWPLREGEPFANASLQYRSTWAGKRRPLVLKLPDETELNVDAATTTDGGGHVVHVEDDGHGLTITGTLVGRSGRAFAVVNGYMHEVRAGEQAKPSDDEGPVSVR